MTPERIKGLRKALEGVTPGPWDWEYYDRIYCIFRDSGTSLMDIDEDDNGKADANFIATFNPVTVSELLDTIERQREALTPSADTKAAYAGEFSFKQPMFDDDGNEVLVEFQAPWITIKEIMKAISSRAALTGDGND